jgi:tetratricopeptide (TPR) repeat protein
MKRACTFAFAVVLLVAALPCIARAESQEDCQGEDLDRRIIGCTDLIDRNDPATDLAQTYAMRGLAYSLKGAYDRAISDFDAAIDRRPNFPAALNNRAWAYYRSGRVRQGMPDIERSIELEPGSAFAYDTRAHMRQALGDSAAALRDYDRALFYGASNMAKLYQCGLSDRGIYTGPLDGVGGPEVFKALEKCAAMQDCDPLPPDEKCR